METEIWAECAALRSKAKRVKTQKQQTPSGENRDTRNLNAKQVYAASPNTLAARSSPLPNKKTGKLDPLSERPNLDFSKGVRGKYSNLLAEGTNLVILDPALLPYFPDSQSVNDALHAFLSLPAVQREKTIAQYRSQPKAFTVSPAAFDPRTGRNSKSAA